MDFGGVFQGDASGFHDTLTAWEMHGSYDFVIAIAAMASAVVNHRAASTGRKPLAEAVAKMNISAGVIVTILVASTIATPPIPESLEIVNLIPGGPVVENELRYGVYTALGLAIALLCVGSLQLARHRSSSGAPTLPAPDAGNVTSTEIGETAEPFVDPVTGKPVA